MVEAAYKGAIARLLAHDRFQAIRRHRLLRFLLVGGVNTVFGYAAFAVVYLLSHHHNLALITATVLGVIFNFFTTGRLVFGNKTWRTLIPFCLAYGVALGVNFLVLNGLIRLGSPPLAAQAISLPVVVVVSYLINAKLVFRQSPQVGLSAPHSEIT